VRVVVIEEDEEGTLRTVLQPAEEFPVDLRADFPSRQIPGLEQTTKPALFEVVAAEGGAADQFPRAHHEIGVVQEAASQTLLSSAVELVTDKPRRRVPVRRECLGYDGMSLVQR